jgi:hypothetical protein
MIWARLVAAGEALDFVRPILIADWPFRAGAARSLPRKALYPDIPY